MNDLTPEQEQHQREERLAEWRFIRAYGQQKWARHPDNERALKRAWDALQERSGTLAHLLADMDQAIDSLTDETHCRCPQNDCEHSRGAGDPNEKGDREHLTAQLRDYGQGVLQEWMRIIELTDVPVIDFQARVTWEDDDGHCHIGDRPGDDDYGRFRITVSVEDLGPVPPIGSDEEEEERATGEDDGLLWVPRTWQDVRAGDDIRLPGSIHVATVTGTNAPGGNRWHVHPAADPYHPELSQVEWTEICVRLEGRTDLLSFDPAGPIEILLSRTEVDAIELLGWENRVRMEGEEE